MWLPLPCDHRGERERERERERGGKERERNKSRERQRRERKRRKEGRRMREERLPTTHIHTYTHMHIHTHTHIHTCSCTSLHTHLHTHTRTFLCFKIWCNTSSLRHKSLPRRKIRGASRSPFIYLSEKPGTVYRSLFFPPYDLKLFHDTSWFGSSMLFMSY